MSWRRPDLAALAAAELTYPEHGATRGSGPLPAGYRHVTRYQRLGAGSACFERAVAALFGWRMHRGAGLSPVVAPPPTVGADVVMRLGPPLIGAIIPCRIVYIEDSPRRRGFGYGTLPGHMAAGEESFIVEWADDNNVNLTIRAFSRFTARRAWFGPVVERGQDVATDRFVGALRRLSRSR
jgi:uncharacterized protein (UPF0548 family)